MSDATDRIESDELRRQLARAWEAGYSAGWTDQLCDFPPHTHRRQSIQGGIMKWILKTIRQILMIPAFLSIYLALAIIEHRERRRGRK